MVEDGRWKDSGASCYDGAKRNGRGGNEHDVIMRRRSRTFKLDRYGSSSIYSVIPRRADGEESIARYRGNPSMTIGMTAGSS